MDPDTENYRKTVLFIFFLFQIACHDGLFDFHACSLSFDLFEGSNSSYSFKLDSHLEFCDFVGFQPRFAFGSDDFGILCDGDLSAQAQYLSYLSDFSFCFTLDQSDFLFDVGFQLSFSAVFLSICMITKNFPPEKSLCEIVLLSGQVFPFGDYAFTVLYFNQTSGFVWLEMW